MTGVGPRTAKALQIVWRVVRVLLITAFGSVDMAVQAVRAGACDFVTKPFGLQELLARLKAHLRRSHGETTADAGTLRFGDVDAPRHDVARADAEKLLGIAERARPIAMARAPQKQTGSQTRNEAYIGSETPAAVAPEKA